MRTTACVGCGAPIAFVTIVRSGKAMPVDVEPHEHGTVVISESPSGLLLGRVLRAGGTAPPGMSTHMSHFATCTDPERFRHKS